MDKKGSSDGKEMKQQTCEIKRCDYYKFFRACKRLQDYKKYSIIKRWIKITEEEINKKFKGKIE